IDEVAAVVRAAMDDPVALRDDGLARDGGSAAAIPAGAPAHASAALGARRAELFLEALDPLDVAKDDADGVRIELEVVPDTRRGLRDRDPPRLERPRRRIGIARDDRAIT